MNKIIVITGPTGVGKTKLSIALAKHLNGEIINADSMQIYKDLNIGTAKVTEAEKEDIPHHLFDIKKVTEDYSVYDYQIDGRKVIDKLLKENKTPIIVGGTGLYIKALLYNYKFNKEVNNNEYDNLSDEELYNKLKLIKPDTDIHPNNRRRIIRALSIKEDNNEGNELLYDAIFIGLTTNRSNLYNIINNRVDKMIEEGLLLEVEALYKKGIRSKAVMTGIGYKELYPYFDKEISLEASVDLIKKNSRHYAKRQYTWFNNQMDVKWFDVHYDEFLKTIDEVLKYIKRITK